MLTLTKSLIFLIVFLTLLAFGLPLIGRAYAEPDYKALSQAIRRVEGVPSYGIKSVHFKDYAEAKVICMRTCKHTWQKWVKEGKKGAYLDYLANKYCPSQSDPRGNTNWKHNIKKLYRE